MFLLDTDRHVDHLGCPTAASPVQVFLSCTDQKGNKRKERKQKGQL